MSELTQAPEVIGQDLFSSSSIQEHALGERAVTPDGRAFRYCKVGETALVPGKIYQAAAEITNHQDVVPAAAAIGDETVTVTLGATVATANFYAGGYLMVSVTPGQGYSYKIKSHPAASSSATLVLTLEEPIEVALTTSSNIDLVANAYSAVIVNPTAASGVVAGAAVYPIAASEYGWLQTHGPANILNDASSTVGTNVSASNSTEGAVEASVTAQAALGIAMTGIATTEYGAIFLTID